MGLLSSVGRPPAGARPRAINGPTDEERPGAGRTGRVEERAAPLDRTVLLRGSSANCGTFDRTRTCDDLRSWGEQRQEYAIGGPIRRGPGSRTPANPRHDSSAPQN